MVPWPCVDICSLECSRLGHESQTWDCYRCDSLNESLISHAYYVDARNPFEVLSSIDDDSVLIILQHLQYHGVYHRCQPNLMLHLYDHQSHVLPPNQQTFRTIMNKRAELEKFFNTTDPGIIIMTETKLKPSTINSEFLPLGYKASHKSNLVKPFLAYLIMNTC